MHTQSRWLNTAVMSVFLTMSGSSCIIVSNNPCTTNNGGCGDPNVWACSNNHGTAVCVAANPCAVNNGGCGDPNQFVCSNSGGNSVCTAVGTPGDLTVLWNFAGHTCFDVPSVTNIHLTIPGQVLQNDGYYPCNNNGIDGIRLLHFAAGTYTLTVDGITASNTIVYSGSVSVTVNGDTQASVTLASSSNEAKAYVTWTFPPNSVSQTPDCTQTGMTTVAISIDNGAPQNVACASGFRTQGVMITTTPGTHTIKIDAGDGSMWYYSRTSTLPNLMAGAAPAMEYSFNWAVGSLPMRWSFSDTFQGRTCADVGVTQVRIDLVDSNNQYVFGTNGTTINCAANNVMGTLFQYLYADTYKLYVQGIGTNNSVYKSNFTNPPQFTVAAGSFPVVDTATPVIDVHLQ